MKKVIFLFLLMTALSVQAQTEYKSLYEEAVRCAESDSLEQAETLFKKALKLEPANAFNSLLFSNLGTVQRRLGHKEDALESYSMALNFAPLSVPILLNRASLYLEMGQEDRAYIDYCNALDVDRENEEALLYRAYIYLNRRDYKSAETDYLRLVRLNPENLTGQMGLATLYQRQKKYQQALEIFNQLLNTHPEDVNLLVARADLEMETEHPDLALFDLDAAIRLRVPIFMCFAAMCICSKRRKRRRKLILRKQSL